MALLLIGTHAFAKGGFEGKMIYSLTLEGEGADQMAGMMPTSYEYWYSKGNIKFIMKGGMVSTMMGEIIVDGAKGITYMVKHDEQKAYKITPEEDAVDADPVVTRLDEQEKILGYKCQKYKVVTAGAATGGGDKVQYVWAAAKLTFAARKGGKIKGGIDMSIKGVDGIPLKTETDVQGMTMIMVCTEIKKGKIDASEFKVPKNYTIEEFDADTMFGQ